MNFNLSVTADWQGRPLGALEDLVRRRQEIIGEDARYSLMATAMNVLKSLRTLAKTAKPRASAKSFKLEETPYAASWERVGSIRHRVVRDSVRGHKVSIYPVNRAGREFVRGERVKVWKITPKYAAHMNWAANLNKGAWYVFALSRGVAEALAKKLMTRALSKESGMARAALGFTMKALHALDDGGATGAIPPPGAVRGAKARRTAESAARVRMTCTRDVAILHIQNLLRYSKAAIKGGDSGISLAMMRAANKTAGLLTQHLQKSFYELGRVKPPFPEIVRER